MKINDYHFHKKFQYLIKWCKPGIKYCLNSNGLIECNKIRTLHGYREINLAEMSKYYWFYIEGGEFITKYEKHKIDNITDLNDFALAFAFPAGLAFALPADLTLALAFAEVMLDTNNLMKL